MSLRRRPQRAAVARSPRLRPQLPPIPDSGPDSPRLNVALPPHFAWSYVSPSWLIVRMVGSDENLQLVSLLVECAPPTVPARKLVRCGVRKMAGETEKRCDG